jgi:hypothetical protein
MYLCAHKRFFKSWQIKKPVLRKSIPGIYKQLQNTEWCLSKMDNYTVLEHNMLAQRFSKHFFEKFRKKWRQNFSTENDWSILKMVSNIYMYVLYLKNGVLAEFWLQMWNPRQKLVHTYIICYNFILNPCYYSS